MTTNTAHTAMIGQESVTAVQRQTAHFVVTAWTAASGEVIHESWTLKP